MTLVLRRLEEPSADTNGLTAYQLDLGTGETLILYSDPRHSLGYCLGNLICSAALALVEFLRTQRASFSNQRVLELGAGAGAVGLSLAKWGANVTLTDMEAMQPLLRHNIDVNFENTSQVHALPLLWADAGVPGAPYDVVVGADVLYDDQHFPSLAATLRRAAGPQTGVYLAAFSYPEYSGLPPILSNCFDVVETRDDLRDVFLYALTLKPSVPPLPAPPSAPSASALTSPRPKRRRLSTEQLAAIRSAVLHCQTSESDGATDAGAP
jgi:hypothetical protein